MIDVSGFGTGIVIVAVQAFPMGFTVNRFADDKDPIKAKEIATTGYEMLYDGSLFSFDKAAPSEIDISVIAGSEEDLNLKILLQSKKGSRRLLPIQDMTSMIITYPDGGRVALSNGTIISGPLVDTVLTNGRKEGNTYKFVFGSITGAQSATQLISGIGQSLLDFL